MDPEQPKAYICLCGNDGSGKSTITRLINQKLGYFCIERSSLNLPTHLLPLQQEIKKIDKLTFAYSFEDDRYEFTPSTTISFNNIDYPVYWCVLHCSPEVLKERLKKRIEMSQYEQEKFIYYFNQIYLEMGYFYGMHIINAEQDIQEVIKQILQHIPHHEPSLGLKYLGLNQIFNADIENYLLASIDSDLADRVFQEHILQELKQSKMYQMYYPELNDYLEDGNLKRILTARWMKNNCAFQFKSKKQVMVKGKNIEMKIQLESGYYFQKIIEGESKMIYLIRSSSNTITRRFKKVVFIVLKSTIYSHKKQNTSNISELGKVRAKGSMIFLQMLRRNNLSHAYICVNKDGIILSKQVETNELEIIFKKELLGTDKHSYFYIDRQQRIVNRQNQYEGGIYIRFDWRNPNHFFNQAPRLTIIQDPYYYVIEKHIGKEKFFSFYLSPKAGKCTPVGDKCISQDVISSYANAGMIKQMVISAYCTFQYYAHENGLEILDGCFMIDEKCQYIWSQINPDCLRVKSIKDREDYDKDIWRVGGSSSKETIMKKWTLFNQIFISYFQNHRFMETQAQYPHHCSQIMAEKILSNSVRPTYKQYYRSMIRGKRRRRVIATIDIIKGEPILVESSVFKEKHSNANLQTAWDYVSIIPQIVVIDIDGAMGRQMDNTKQITSLAQKPSSNLFAVGGGIRTIEKVKYYLSVVGKIIISSQLQLLEELSEEEIKKVIVELSINENNEVLTHGRTVNTKVNVIEKMRELCLKGIKTISITFRNNEGKLEGLPRKQLKNLMDQVPGPIENIIIAGGISSIEDMEYVWSYSKCIPQLGSAIWKNKIQISQIYNKMVRFNPDSLVPTVIQTQNNKCLGLIYLNEQAIERTCKQRLLYRYSRQHQRLMKKGQKSNNEQKVISMNIDCDNDTLLITVEEKNQFCHLGVNSCFSQNYLQNYNKSIQGLQTHIGRSKTQCIGSGYTHKMQNHPQLLHFKMVEEVNELPLAQTKERKTQEAADLLSHLLMYLNAQDISINDVLGIMNQRSRQIKAPHPKSEKKQILVGIANGKHKHFIQQFMRNRIGIQIIPSEQKNYNIQYKVIDQVKLKSYFSDTDIKLIGVSPKDMLNLMTKSIFDYGINYSSVLSSFENEYVCLCSEKVEKLKLVLLRRKGTNPNPKEWNRQRKGHIASQYPFQVWKYFTSLGISSDCYSLVKITGKSQSFLRMEKFDYCDAIIHSGKTMEINNLEVETVLFEPIETMLFRLDD